MVGSSSAGVPFECPFVVGAGAGAEVEEEAEAVVADFEPGGGPNKVVPGGGELSSRARSREVMSTSSLPVGSTRVVNRVMKA